MERGELGSPSLSQDSVNPQVLSAPEPQDSVSSLCSSALLLI